jgi:hypothetical protein
MTRKLLIALAAIAGCVTPAVAQAPPVLTKSQASRAIERFVMKGGIVYVEPARASATRRSSLRHD